MLEYWLAAFGLMLVLEGIMPFAFPSQWRSTLLRVAQFQDGQLRFFGLLIMLIGTLILFWVRNNE